MSIPPVSVGSISSIVRPRVGFHFEIDSTVKLNELPLCADLKIQYHLPPDLFVDPYELDLRSAGYSYKIHPVVDLEVPVLAAGHSYSTVELVVHTPLLDQGTRQHSVVLPLHARYGHPSLVLNPDESYEIMRVLQPIASWPCEIAEFPKSQLELNATVPDLPLFVPVGLGIHRDIVEAGTVITVAASFLYLLWVSITTVSRISVDRKRK